MRLALLFPGQGTQHPLMLRWLEGEPAARDLLQHLGAALGTDWRARLDDAAWANANHVAQPLLVGLELAAWACLAAELPQPVAIAGYSVGELAAFSAAGVFDSATALALAHVRAEAMDRSGAGSTSLVVVRDVPLVRIASWCERHGLAIAIWLGPDRAVVGGPVAALAEAVLDSDVAGRSTPLAVRVASHTPWMRPAAAAFAEHLEGVCLHAARAPLVCNATGASARQPPALRDALARQIAAPVLWDQCLDAVLERGATCVLEVGPGNTLSAMSRIKAPHVPARSVDEFQSARAVVDWVRRTLAR